MERKETAADLNLKNLHAAELTLEHVDLGGAIPVTVAMDDTEVHKPDPTPLLLALERLGGVAADAVYIGDAVVDVRAARAAGMASIAVTWGAGEVADLVAAGPTAWCIPSTNSARCCWSERRGAPGGHDVRAAARRSRWLSGGRGEGVGPSTRHSRWLSSERSERVETPSTPADPLTTDSSAPSGGRGRCWCGLLRPSWCRSRGTGRAS